VTVRFWGEATMKISDSFMAGEEHFEEVLNSQPAEEPTYGAPKTWPHQVPEEHRRSSA
jgi:hypothetical protein